MVLHQPDSAITILFRSVHWVPVFQPYDCASDCPSFWLAVVVAELHGPDEDGPGALVVVAVLVDADVASDSVRAGVSFG
jgi:hypothetical protein